MKSLFFTAMGSKISIFLDSSDDSIIQEMKKAYRWFEEWEASLSRFKNESEICMVNRNSGKEMIISNTFFQILSLALRVEENTGGLVSPSILPALENAGYNVSFENFNDAKYLFRLPFNVDIQKHHPILNDQTKTVFIPFGMKLDLGGIAKGYAAHQTMLRLRNFAPVLVDAGGDIAISGSQQSGEAWPIGIANPFANDDNLDLILVREAGVATSGKDFRRWYRNNQWQHHIIDPRTGFPAETDILTSTVIADDVITAEAAAKAALIQGSEHGKKWLDQQDHLAYLLVLDNGKIIRSDNLYEYEWKTQCPQMILT